MNNPLHPPLMRLFERLSFLKGLLIHLKNQHDNYPPLLKKTLEDHNLDPSLMMARVALGIRDLTQSVESFRGYYPVAVSGSRNLDEYKHMLEDILCRNCGWVVAQGYEAFDTFLKDIIAIYLQENNASIAPTIQRELTRNKKNLKEISRAGFSQTDFEYWRSCIKAARWNNKMILDKIRGNFSPKLKDVELNNQPSIDFIEWFDFVSEVRHAVTHSNGTIKPERQDPGWLQHTLGTYFPGNITPDGYELKLTVESGEKNLKRFAEYGYVIFKCLSDEQNYKVNVFP